MKAHRWIIRSLVLLMVPLGIPHGLFAQAWAHPLKTSDAGVEISVTPVDTGSAKEWKFEVSMNTHSVDLDFDLALYSTLLNDRGTVASGALWQGSDGGHHVTGILSFGSWAVDTLSLTLIIDAPGLKKRTYAWKLGDASVGR